MAEMKTLNGYEIVDEKAREEIVTEKAKVEKMKAYVTPEMFREVGDTDAVAIQKAFDYAKVNHVSVKLDKNYYVDDTLVLDSGNSYQTRGLMFDGQGHCITITVDKPLLKSRGAYNRISNLDLNYSDTFETETGCNYNCSLLTLEGDASNSTFLCTGTMIDNVACAPVDMTNKKYVKNNAGFEIVCNGTPSQPTHAYMINFKSCVASNLGTAIKITMNEHNEGCNGNSFDINSWSCSKYVDGKANGSTFYGLVQAQLLIRSDGAVLNPYLLNNIGTNNIFNSIFFDADWGNGTHQKIWHCVTTTPNVFTHPCDANAFDGAVDSSKFTFVGDRYHPTRTIPFNTVVSTNYLNTVANFPAHNSLGVEGVEITAEWENFLEPAVELNHDFSLLFKENPWNRGTGTLYAKPNATFTFNITAPEPVYLGTVFVVCNQWLPGEPSKVEVINGTDGTVSEGNVVEPNYGRKLYFVEGRGGESATWKLKFTFNIGGADGSYAYEGFSQICGYMFSPKNGII